MHYPLEKQTCYNLLVALSENQSISPGLEIEED